jgi:hypothetical protein
MSRVLDLKLGGLDRLADPFPHSGTDLHEGLLRCRVVCRRAFA